MKLIESILGYFYTLRWYFKKEHHKDFLFISERFIPQVFFWIGTFISSLLGINCIVIVIGFFLGISINKYELLLSIVITNIISFLIIRETFKTFIRSTLFSLFILLVVVGLFICFFKFSQNIFDISYDGQAYHQEAILKLHDGWNPIYREIQVNESGGLTRWINHYAKSPWYSAASFYKLIGDLEGSKAVNFLLITASFCFTFFALSLFKKINFIQSLLLSLIIAFNPVSIYQSLSFYVDGQLSSGLIGLLSLSIVIFYHKKNYFFIPFILLAVYVINIKLTAIIYAFLILFFLLLLVWYDERVTLARKLFFCYIFIVCCSLLAGFNPYVTNILRAGNPFYPAAGKNSINFVDSNYPKQFAEKNFLYRFSYSLFATPSNERHNLENVSLKNPFTYSAKDLTTYSYTDTKFGGYGPIFGGIMLISSLLLLVSAFIYKPKVSYHVILSICMLIFLSVIMSPLNSVARFVPQLWLIPCFVILLLFLSKKVYLHLIGYILLLTICFNLFLVMQQYYKFQNMRSNEIRQELNILKTMDNNGNIIIYFDEFNLSNKQRLSNNGISFEEKKNKCNGKRIMSESIIIQCN